MEELTKFGNDPKHILDVVNLPCGQQKKAI